MGIYLGVFYTYVGMVGAQDSEWLQYTLNIIIGLFQRYGLVGNVVKYWTITCQTGALQLGMLREAVVRGCMGLGVSCQERPWRRIPCTECGVEPNSGFMASHLISTHGTETEIDWNRLTISQTEHLPQVYEASSPKGTTHYSCPFPG